MQTTHSHLAIVALQMVPLMLFAQDAADRPNILFIMCDDMGYGNIACYGQPFINTLVWTRWHAKVCASRKPMLAHPCRHHHAPRS